MYRGIAYVIGACLCWSLVFVLPQLVGTFSPLEVVIGRSFFFGLFSLILLLFQKPKGLFFLSPQIWIRGAALSLLGSFIHYGCLVFSLRQVNPTIPTLILGLTPVCIPLIHNIMIKKEGMGSLLLPSLLIVAGLLCIHVPSMIWGGAVDRPIPTYLWGIFWSLAALATWVGFLMGNAHFLKKSAPLTPSYWMAILGVTNFFWTVLILLILSIPFLRYPLSRHLIWNRELAVFLTTTALLGICSSWLGFYMWNRAVLRIPLGLAGQFSILEAVFGVILVHIVIQKLPTLIEAFGILITFIGILINFSKLSNDKVKVLQ
jgi:drug/metabolite transporter (DMT)-like permease